MYAVVIHESGGRIDAEDVRQLCQASRLMFDAGMAAPKYALLALCATLEEAGRMAADLRRVRRERAASEEKARG